MGNTLSAGDPNNWDPNSMAGMMETALAPLVTLPPDDDPLPRRKLLVAIATGVINHLKANADAFTILVPEGSGANTQVHPTIN